MHLPWTWVLYKTNWLNKNMISSLLFETTVFKKASMKLMKTSPHDMTNVANKVESSSLSSLSKGFNLR